MKPLELLPAIDIKNGKVIQLSSAVSGSTTVMVEPLEVIQRFSSAGSKWIHLVDLDAAYGTGENAKLIKHLVQMSQVDIQLSGGIANQKSLDAALATSAKRVNISTAGLEDIDWIENVIKKYRERVCVGLDVSHGSLIARGSGKVIGDLDHVISVLNEAGCSRIIVTDNSTDGALVGPNFQLLEQVISQSSAEIVASGGVSNLSDLQQLRKMGLAGAIVGKALYVGQFSIEEALDTCYK
ncbi:MAG: bifunctional 1-(5-phosphoribosyl)-5-((5-phosphoribosylamino)methylideneamino)imidazole-4-carboxamide isomerase/phosphoribosylanthranilate isomerase PriA [Candidatus Nanopelagicus sp.]|nr:bifunctional 1-(5-phosphoribosyl)-5-((5-phosphoribosylamino)methylideneamino)imidazole-4-carboxamide isomerase/phosphoribosylanthranilate isomerase PriA [Candidatus Nanopelagicus sp.]